MFLQRKHIQEEYLFLKQPRDRFEGNIYLFIMIIVCRKNAHHRRMKVCFWWFQPPSLASRST